MDAKGTSAKMKRHDFIKTSSLLLAGGVLAPNMSCNTKKNETLRKNWAGNYTYKAKNYYEPASVDEVQQLVKKLDKQKALGSHHCFNDIADSAKIRSLSAGSTKSCTLTPAKIR